MKNLISLFIIIVISGRTFSNVEKKEKPNILFILADDTRYGVIRSLGNNQIITPNLDALIKRGISFNNCYIQGGTIEAICTHSQAMLLTGKNLFSLQKHGKIIPDEHTLLGEHLQKNFYNSFGTGKWHNGKNQFNRCFNKADAIFMGGIG